jgi:hypothetical protein
MVVNDRKELERKELYSIEISPARGNVRPVFPGLLPEQDHAPGEEPDPAG